MFHPRFPDIGLPRQENSYDCGVVVALFAYHYLFGRQWQGNRSSREMREFLKTSIEKKKVDHSGIVYHHGDWLICHCF